MSIAEVSGGHQAVPQRLRTDQDRRAHVPVHVVWEITLACNLKCGHCGSRPGKRRANELSTAECLDVVRQLAAARTREITLIAGQAHLRRDRREVAAETARLGIPSGGQTGAPARPTSRSQPAL